MNAVLLFSRILLLLSLQVSGAPSASTAMPTPTCQPIPGYWFQETILVEDVPLPEGLQVRASERSGEPRAELVIHNQSSENLFILSLRYADQLLGDATLDPMYAARLDYAHEVASYLVPAEDVRSLGLDMSALADLDLELVDRNRLELSRPPDAQRQIPDPGYSRLLLVHGKEVYTVPFTVAYRLNPDYSPSTCPDQGPPTGTSARDDARNMVADIERSLPIMLLVVVLVFSLVTFLLFRLTHHRKG